MKEIISHNIRIIRDLTGLDQVPFAQKLKNVKKGKQQSYEYGTAKAPDSYLQQIAKMVQDLQWEDIKKKKLDITELKLSPEFKEAKKAEKAENIEDSFPSDPESDMFQTPNISEPGASSAQQAEKPRPSQNDLQKAVIDQAATIRLLTEILHRKLGTA